MRRKRDDFAFKRRAPIGLIIIIAACAAAIFFILYAVNYAGGFVDEQTEEQTPEYTIAEMQDISGADGNGNIVEVIREESGKQKDISEMSLEEIWINDPREPVTVRGIYVSDSAVATPAKMDELIALCDETEVNAMVINIKNDDGHLTFDSASVLGTEIGAERIYIEDLPALLTKLEEHGIYSIARIVTFKDTYLAKAKPEFACKTKTGDIYYDNSGCAWINPYNKDSWDYFVALGKEAAALGFDEVQFDYLRFSTGTGYKDIDYGETNGVSKQDIIAEFTEYAYRELIKTGVFISADVYGVIVLHESDGELIGQGYKKMAKYLDYICPMNYPSHYNSGEYGIDNPDASPYEFNYALCQDSVRLLEEQAREGHVAKVRPWMQAFTATWVKGYIEYGPDEYRAQIQAAYDSGYDEWFFWNASGNYNKDGFLKE